MKFMAIADSDIGIVKDTNQDSLLIKHADTQRGRYFWRLCVTVWAD